MVEFITSEIKNVTVGFSSPDVFHPTIKDRDKLVVHIVVDALNGPFTSGTFEFVLTNPTEVQRLMRLMNYTEANEVGDLKGKVIRQVVSLWGEILGSGHINEDKFFLHNTEDFEELSGAQIKKMLSDK